jgi:hypothetical protein
VAMTAAIHDVGTRPEVLRELTRRIQAEYAEMPGLSVTLAQAQRLWAIDRHTCETAFMSLTARGLLRVTTKGRYVRARL